jgi:hypothetical protein
MHEGEDTEFYLACGANVIAFEANDCLVDKNNVRFAKHLASGQLRIMAGAIVSPDFNQSEQTFYVNEQKSVWGTTSRHWAERNASLGTRMTSVTVPVIDLKGVIAANPEILYAKIDIEGADWCVLETFKVSSARPKFISLESDKLDINKVINEIEALQDLGYTRFAAVQQATVPSSKIRSRRFDGGWFEHRFKKHSSGPFGPYLNQDYVPAGAVIDQYRSIFRAYARFGDQSWLMQHRGFRGAVRGANYISLKALRKPLCGWYDTHAAV